MKAAKFSLGVLAKNLFFDPLRMQSSTFDLRIDRVDPRRIVPTEIDPWRKREICGEVHDESTHVLQNLYGKNRIGIAGLFSTVPDLLTFLEMLLNGGALRGRRYFSEEMVTRMHTNHFPHAVGAEGPGGLGWSLYPQGYMGNYGTPQTFGKTGFTGCMILADRKKELGLVILSNYHYPHRKKDLEPNRQFRADIADSMFGNFK
jgi:CubicO group peptidase (beta-lactamase class C family)